MIDRLQELSKMFHTHPDKGGTYLSLYELQELASLQYVEIERLKKELDDIKTHWQCGVDSSSLDTVWGRQMARLVSDWEGLEESEKIRIEQPPKQHWDDAQLPD